MAGPEGFEPSPTVLETGMLPLHYGPIVRPLLDGIGNSIASLH